MDDPRVPDADALLKQGEAIQAHADNVLAQLKGLLAGEEASQARPHKLANLRKAIDELERLRRAGQQGHRAFRRIAYAWLGRGPIRMKDSADVLRLSGRARDYHTDGRD